MKNKVNDFLTKVDNACFDSLQSVFLEFKDHSFPIVRKPTMLEFIDEAPAIFGDTWHHLCKRSGVELNQKAGENTTFLASIKFYLKYWQWLAGLIRKG